MVLAAAPAGCGAGDTASFGATVRDSAGIRIVELPATSPAAHEVGVHFDAGFSVPASIEFGQIADVDAAGALIAVLDEQAAAVTTLDTTGRVIARFGRAGGGPGEFDPRGLASVIVADGAVWVPDVASQRLTRFTADGTVLETLPLPLAEGHAVDWTPHPAGGRVHRLRDPAGDLLIRSGAAGTDTLHRFPTSVDPPNTMLAATPLWTVLPDGAIVVGSTDRFDLSLLEPGRRRPTWTLRRVGAADAVTDADRMHVRSLLEMSLMRRTGGELAPELRERMLSGVRLADRPPVLAAIRTGPEGTLWVERARAIRSMGMEVLRVGAAAGLGSNEWEIYDRRGTFLGTATLPDGFALEAFAGTLIYGILTDELGVQTVRRLRVEPN